MRLPTRLKSAMYHVAPPPPLLMAALLVMVAAPPRAAAYFKSNTVSRHYSPLWARSVGSHPPQEPQHIIHVSDSHAPAHNDQRLNNGVSSDHHSHHNVPGTITISGFGGTITITPAGSGTNIDIHAGNKAGVHPDAGFQSQAGRSSDADFGNNSGGNSFINSNSNSLHFNSVGGSAPSSDPGSSERFNFDSRTEPDASFVGGPDSSSQRYPAFNSATSGFSSDKEASNPSSNLATGADSNSNIHLNSHFISEPSPNLNSVSRPNFSFRHGPGLGFDPNADPSLTTNPVTITDAGLNDVFTETPSSDPSDFNPGANIGTITSSFERFGSNLNRRARLGANPGAGAITSGQGSRGPGAATGTGGQGSRAGSSGAPAATSSTSRSTTRRPVTSRFGPNFGMRPGHTRRKTCKKTVNTTIEYDLRLIPYQIPVVGEEVAESGCARDEIRFGTSDGPCIRALDQGTCGVNQWILFNNATNVGQCQERPCPIGYAFVKATGLCHHQFQAGFCPGDRLIQVTASGESVCGCDDGWFPDRCGYCQLIYSHEGCPSGLAYQFNTLFQLRCLPSPCSDEKPVPLPGGGGCSAFGEPCLFKKNNETRVGTVGFLSDSLAISCISLDATTSRRRRAVVPAAGRVRRAVFGALTPVNSCQPGARTDFNNACRSAAVPSRNRRATETKSPTCPRVSNHYLPPALPAPAQ